MRRLHRPTLPPACQSYLRRKQNEVDSDQVPDLQITWKRSRRTKTMKTVAKILRRMSGARERCFYCCDSAGTRIDHFWPKADHPEYSFDWENMIAACGDCNESKGDEFDFDLHGVPKLINPTEEDPWEYLYYDSSTGEIVPRWVRVNTKDPYAEYTLETISHLRSESVVVGRLAAQNNLREAVARIIEPQASRSAASRRLDELLHSIQRNDSYGLLEWFFIHEGAEEAPFSELRRRFQAHWQILSSAIARGPAAVTALNSGDFP